MYHEYIMNMYLIFIIRKIEREIGIVIIRRYLQYSNMEDIKLE